MRRPQRPGNQCAPRRASGGTLLMIHPRESSGPLALPQCSGRARRKSRLNVEHSAPSPTQHQEQTRSLLCRNCECQNFFVESNGKPVLTHLRATTCRREASISTASFMPLLCVAKKKSSRPGGENAVTR